MLFRKLVETGDGSLTIEHDGHGEAFHSRGGARQEAVDLYVLGSGFSDRLGKDSRVRILDVGLGLGYNALASIDRWWREGGKTQLEITSLEMEGELVRQLSSGEGVWQKNWDEDWLSFCACLSKVPLGYAGCLTNASGGELVWTVLVGDAFEASLEGSFDYVWQDPFSPGKNPRMWGEEWFRFVSHRCHAGSTLMTYSVSRVVKDGLKACGWDYEVIETTTEKRGWLRARYNYSIPAKQKPGQ